MPFNSDSYYRNKYRREALASLADARRLKTEPIDDIRVRIWGAEGAAERRQADIESAVRLARICWRLYLGQAAICRIREGARAAFRK